MFMVMDFTGPNAGAIKEAYIEAFNAMQRRDLNLSQRMPELIAQRGRVQGLGELRLTGAVRLAGDRLMTDSIRVAHHFGKSTRTCCLRSTGLDCSAKYRVSNFGETIAERPNPKGGKPILRRVVQMTNDGFVFLVMGFTGPKAEEGARRPVRPSRGRSRAPAGQASHRAYRARVGGAHLRAPPLEGAEHVATGGPGTELKNQLHAVMRETEV